MTVRSLHDRFVVVEETIALGDWSLRLAKPRSAEDLISEEEFAQDERLPYWADLWPSASALATHVLAHVDPRWRVLELGCGLGVVSLAARRRGAAALATDYYQPALEFAAYNAAANDVAPLLTRLVDWRDWPDDLVGFDLIVGADILYERPMGLLVAAAIAKALAPRGRAWIADPGRVGAEPFVAACSDAGLRVAVRALPSPEPDPRRITLYEVTR